MLQPKLQLAGPRREGGLEEKMGQKGQERPGKKTLAWSSTRWQEEAIVKAALEWEAAPLPWS